MENNIDVNADNAKWIIDNHNHRIVPFVNHFLAIDYNPNGQYNKIVIRRHTVNNPKLTKFQAWEFRDKLTGLTAKNNSRSSRARVWEFTQDDIDDIFVSFQKSKLLKFARKLPNNGIVRVNESPNNIFCYVDMSHWDNYSAKLREKIIEHYDFVDGSSLYYFLNKYYPFIVKHHSLTPKSKLYLATKIYKNGYHISIDKRSVDLVGKKIKFKCTSIHHIMSK